MAAPVDEHLILEYRACDVRVGTNQAMVADCAAMARAGAHHAILHHDAVPSECDHASSLADQARAVHDAGARTDRDIAANAKADSSHIEA
jgi:hypothetical protein